MINSVLVPSLHPCHHHRIENGWRLALLAIVILGAVISIFVVVRSPIHWRHIPSSGDEVASWWVSHRWVSGSHLRILPLIFLEAFLPVEHHSLHNLLNGQLTCVLFNLLGLSYRLGHGLGHWHCAGTRGQGHHERATWNDAANWSFWLDHLLLSCSVFRLCSSVVLKRSRWSYFVNVRIALVFFFFSFLFHLTPIVVTTLARYHWRRGLLDLFLYRLGVELSRQGILLRRPSVLSGRL